MIDTLNKMVRKIPTWPVYVIMVAHFAWLFYRALTGATGPEPIRPLEHALGDIAIQVFIVVIAITPARKYLGLNLLKFRRALGLAVMFYVTMHLAVWLFLDVGIISEIWNDIIKRPYITVGMVGFAALIPLAITSNNFSIKKIGAAGWRKLHRLTYAAVILGAVHNVMIQKVWEFESTLYLVIILVLLATRIRLPQRAMG